jgi:nicotinamidase-related amidase
MRAALVLVDLQHDFLDRTGLVPPPEPLTAAVAGLLSGCRQRRLPVIHVHTVVSPDGHDRMPHWIRSGTWTCVEGTRGAQPPAAVAPAAGEPVVRKPYFSGFGNPRLDELLRGASVDTVVVAGIYLHGCVRSTVLDAYERGYTVWVADEATGSTEPEHAARSRAWLATRAAEFMTTSAILARLDAGTPAAP